MRSSDHHTRVSLTSSPAQLGAIPQEVRHRRHRSMSERVLEWAHLSVWLTCVLVYGLRAAFMQSLNNWRGDVIGGFECRASPDKMRCDLKLLQYKGLTGVSCKV